MGMAKKSIADRVKKAVENRKDTSSNLNYRNLLNGRYIFFASLFDGDSRQKNLANNAQNHLLQLTNFAIQENMDMESINYIAGYLAMLEQLRDKERSIEQNFLRTYPNIKDNYYDEENFDYLTFIKDLNVSMQGLDRFKKIMLKDRARFRTIIETENHNYNELKKKFGEKAADDWKEELQKKNEISYRRYAREMNKILDGKTLKDDLSNMITKRINRVFDFFINDTATLERLVKQIMENNNKSNAPRDVSATVQNFCVQYVLNEIKTKKQTGFEDVPINKEALQKAIDQFSNDIEKDYTEVLRQASAIFEQILNRSLTTKSVKGKENVKMQVGGIGELFFDNIEDDRELDQLIDTLQKIIDLKRNSNSPGNEVKEIYELANSKKNPRGKKQSLTYNFNKLMRELFPDYTKYTKEDVHQQVQELVEKYNKSLQSNLGNAAIENAVKNARFKLKTTIIGPSSVAEIISTNEFTNFIKDNLGRMWVPGTKIQYKDDVTFGFVGQGVDIGPIDFSFLDQSNSISEDQKNFLKNTGQQFLKNYKKASNGATNVLAASQAFIDNAKDALKIREQLESEGIPDVEKFFDNLLAGGISVKEYQLYNNDFGYHMGSMGGEGRVVDAIPNILKMIELGGIEMKDAELIIQILLNCFDDSVIGSSPFEDIKNLLIGGAAMMLFDDGFANCENFLEKMQNELHTDKAVSGGSLHLLYLNGVYIPQSLLLTKIIDNLKIVYSEILNINIEKIAQNNQNKLVLNNPLSNKIYEEIKGQYQTSAERWEAVSLYAQDNVKISFMFMAGMLDILDGIADSFK